MLSESDSLTATLEKCLSELIKKQEEQGDRLFKAIAEALKPPAPDLITDKKTKFWNSYMKLADEYDKEFQEKYTTDLDTSLIFSGLFSAVASAFIIQIQPQLTAPARTTIVVVETMLYASLFITLLAALLAVLGKQWIMFYVAAGSRGTIAERGLERQRKLDGLTRWKFEAVLKMFPLLLQLGLLLFAVSMSVYLWTVHHAPAILAMTLTAVGFGIYFFLLVSAIRFSDCPFRTPLAPVLKLLLAWIPYGLSRLLLRARSALPSWARHALWILKLRCQHFKFTVRHPLLPRWLPFQAPAPQPGPDSSSSPEGSAVLWVLKSSTDPIVVGVASDLGADLEWPAKLDLEAVAPAMNRLEDTFIPLMGSYAPSEGREIVLSDDIAGRVITAGRMYCSLRLLMGCTRTAKVYGEKYLPLVPFSRVGELESVLRLIGDEPALAENTATWALHVIPGIQFNSTDNATTLNLLYCLSSALNNIQPVDEQLFTNYLCCVGSFFGVLPNVDILRRLDKSLLTQLFIALGHSSSPDLVSLALRITVEVADRVTSLKCFNNMTERVNLIKTAFDLCRSFRPGESTWPEIVASVAQLIRVDDLRGRLILHSTSLRFSAQNNDTPWSQSAGFNRPNSRWIYTALEHVHQGWNWDARGRGKFHRQWELETARKVDALLQLLAWCEIIPADPPLECVRIILTALSASTSTIYSAFLVLHRARSWFGDERLVPILSQVDLPHSLGEVVLQLRDTSSFDEIVIGYVKMIQALIPALERRGSMPGLSTWIRVFLELHHIRVVSSRQTLQLKRLAPHPLEDLALFRFNDMAFLSVTRNTWTPEFDTTEFTGRQLRTALAVSAICNVWEACNFNAVPTLEEIRELANCTVVFALLEDGQFFTPLDNMPVHFTRICDALANGARNANTAFSGSSFDSIAHPYESPPPPNTELGGYSSPFVERMAALLETLAWRLRTELKISQDGTAVYTRRAFILEEFKDQIDDLLGSDRDATPE